MSGDPPPRWVKCLVLADRGLETGAWLLRTALGRVLCLSVPAARRDTVTAWVYARESHYRPGSALFEGGLFGWEREALRTPPFPRGGRVLVGGVGGGRELVGLASLGYQVVAFEPSPLVEAAQDAARASPGSEVVRASYQDLVAVAEGRTSPLAPILDGGFDGVVLGWGSLSHVVSAEERRRVMVSLNRLLPGAPVLCSFWADREPLQPTRARQRLWRVGRWVERLHEPGLRFQARAGFMHVFTRDGFERLARDTGYRVVLYEETPFPHALLAPVGAPAPGGT